MNFEELDGKMRRFEQSLDQVILPEMYVAVRMRSGESAYIIPPMKRKACRRHRYAGEESSCPFGVGKMHFHLS